MKDTVKSRIENAKTAINRRIGNLEAKLFDKTKKTEETINELQIQLNTLDYIARQMKPAKPKPTPKPKPEKEKATPKKGKPK